MADLPGAFCPFCQRIADDDYDVALSIHGSVAVFAPLNPVTPGHLLVVPWRHVMDAAAGPDEAATVMRHAARLVAAAATVPAANIITSIGSAATQTVYHLHLHIVPRHDGDGLALPWTGQVGHARPAGGAPPGNPWVLEQETIRCETCGAEPGRRCVSASGATASFPHACRLAAAADRKRVTGSDRPERQEADSG